MIWRTQTSPVRFLETLYATLLKLSFRFDKAISLYRELISVELDPDTWTLYPS